MKMTSILSLLLMFLLGCWSYQKDYRKTRYTALPLVDNYSLNSPLDNSLYEETKERWQQSLLLKENNITHLYDFTTKDAQKMRVLAAENLDSILQQKISLPLLLCLAYERNPRLAEAQKKWQATKERYSQAFFLQNLLTQYNSFTRSLDTKVNMQMQKQQVHEFTPFPSFLTIMGEIITKEIQIARWEYEIILREVINSMAMNYIELCYNREIISIQKQNLQIAHSLESTARDKFRAGLASYDHVLKAQILKAEIEVEINNYQAKEKAIYAQIAALLDYEFIVLENVENTPIIKMTLSAANIYDHALHNKQEIELVKIETQKLERLIALAKDKLYPDFTSGWSYFENKNAELIGQENVSSFPETLRPMPKFSFGQKNSYIHEMEIRKTALEQKQKELEQTTKAAIHNAYFEIEKHQREYNLYQQKLIPLARETLKVTRITYQAGKNADFLDVLDAAKSLLKFQLNLEQHKKNCLLAIVNLQNISNMKILLEKSK